MPSCADSSRPAREATAPVKAPRTWPNSSDSSRVSGTALQLRATKRWPRRGLLWWIALAASSLPVPVSPVTRTVLGLAATVSSRSNSSRIRGLRPTSPSNRYRSWICDRSQAFSDRRRRCSRAERITCSNWSNWKGLVMKSAAPRLSAATASATVPNPVTTTHTMSG